MGRPERLGGVASNSVVNTTDGPRKIGPMERAVGIAIAAAIESDGRVTIVDGDGNEYRLWPVDAKTQILRGSATLKGKK